MENQTDQFRFFNFGENKDQLNKMKKYPINFVKTSKYTLLTFLPYTLLLQFKQYANIYFLIIAVLQTIPQITTLSPASAILPLAFVIILSMAREGIEDYKKFKQDKENNSSPGTLLNNKEWQKCKWMDMKIGDLIKIECEELIPTDCIVIKSALKTGQCFIETSSLDGEKNLKPKQSVQATQDNQIDKIMQYSGECGCIPPNPLLGNFEGFVQIQKQAKIPVSAKNLILRGARLKNVEYVIGLVVYTGKDTKVMKNSGKSTNKTTKILKKLNKYILVILTVQMIFCLIVSFGFLWKCHDDTNITYEFGQVDCRSEFFFNFAGYFLLLNTMLPISLIVSLEFIKVGQAYFMEKDQELYTDHNEKSLTVNTCQINEELGQVQYIFTDKTGTLTCNKMEFKMLVAGKETYGDLNIKQSENPYLSLHPLKNDTRVRAPSYQDTKGGVEFCFKDQRMSQIMTIQAKQQNLNLKIYPSNNKSLEPYLISGQKDLIEENLLILSLCHECILHKENDGSTTYQGPSPDEIALVDAARHMGYEYKGSDQDQLILEYEQIQRQYKLLYMFEFDSDRKRMTVIVRDEQTGIIKLFCKGADSIIISRLDKQSEQPFLSNINQKLTFFSEKGLRTLCLAMRIISEEELSQIDIYMKSIITAQNRENLIKVKAEEIEKNLFLIGATAVEDRLQDQVPETLRDILKANIKVWMLTGDKLETAENIGKSCNLLTNDSVVEFFRGNKTDDQLQVQLYKLMKQQDSNSTANYSILVEGEALAKILNSVKLIILFLKIVIHCKSVICCRVTPKQKAEVVKLVKEKLGKITLSIGDGANDVNMIQEAHIGIGIYGNEGMRAVQASDYAIGQFKCMWKLILFHGRMSYIRISECILYFFYKNMIFSIQQFYFAFFCLYSGQSIFDDWYITFYNMIFTFAPVVIRAVFEQDVHYKAKNKQQNSPDKDLNEILNQQDYDQNYLSEEQDRIRSFYPKLYYIGQKNHIFQAKKFVKYIVIGLVQGLFCFFICIYSFAGVAVLNSEGYTPDIWCASITLYTAIIVIVNLKLALNTQYWTVLTWVGLLLSSIGAYILYIFMADNISFFVIYQTLNVLVSSPVFYSALFLSIVSMFSVDLMSFYFKISKESLLNYFKETYKKSEELNTTKASELYVKQNLMYRDSILRVEKKLDEKKEELNISRIGLENDTMNFNSNSSNYNNNNDIYYHSNSSTLGTDRSTDFIVKQDGRIQIGVSDNNSRYEENVGDEFFQNRVKLGTILEDDEEANSKQRSFYQKQFLHDNVESNDSRFADQNESRFQNKNQSQMNEFNKQKHTDSFSSNGNSDNSGSFQQNYQSNKKFIDFSAGKQGGIQ